MKKQICNKPIKELVFEIKTEARNLELIQEKISNLEISIIKRIDNIVYVLCNHYNIDINTEYSYKYNNLTKASNSSNNFIDADELIYIDDDYDECYSKDMHIAYDSKIIDLAKLIPISWLDKDEKTIKKELKAGRKQYLKIKNFQ